MEAVSLSPLDSTDHPASLVAFFFSLLFARFNWPSCSPTVPTFSGLVHDTASDPIWHAARLDAFNG